MKKPELLAPAGAAESLVAAVQNGANAVYFGTGGFNARASAANFHGEEARNAIDYCHERGVRAYLTLNTLILDKELPAALETAARLYEYGADAFIVQDVGLIAQLKKHLPGIELHGSTQMAIHNAPGVEAAQSLGLSRVVLARETSLENIRHIKKRVPFMALEAFVHGAMCASVSGQCLLSSFIGERSGNRGACAQPCRLPFRMGSAQGYLLSMKDMCMLEHLGALAQAGVESFKIEGRMKRPEYVAVVTRAYRRAIDGEITDFASELDALKRIFDRGPFSTGYYFSRDGLVEQARSGNVAAEADREQLRQAQESCSGENRKTPFDAVFSASIGKPAELTLSLGTLSVKAFGEPVQSAMSAPLTEEKIRSSLEKTGGTPYSLRDLRICIEPEGANIFLTISALNDLRRKGIELLSNALKNSRRRIAEPISLSLPPDRTTKRKTLLSARVATTEQAREALAHGADELQIGLRQWDAKQIALWDEFAKEAGVPTLIDPPTILLDEDFEHVIDLLHGTAFAGAVAGNVGQIAPLRELYPIVRGDFTLNAANTLSAQAHQAMELDSVTLSVELTVRQICDIIKKVDCDIVLYGKIPMMHLLHCPIRRTAGKCAADCASGRSVTDRKGVSFDLLPMSVGANRCDVQLLNSVPMDGLKFFGELEDAGARAFTLLFATETAQETAERVSAYRAALDTGSAASLANSTGGHLARGL